MNPHLAPFVVLVWTVVSLGFVRSRTLPLQVTAELSSIVVLAAWLASAGSYPLPSPEQIAGRADGTWIQALAGIWWLVMARFVVTAFALVRGRSAHTREARLFSDLASGAIYFSALFVVLNSILDLPVRGLLATSGVVAIVVGLALQSTLTDVFSGIAVGIERTLRVGDLVSIGDGPEGVVVEMNWRAVHLRTADADVRTVPNSIVAKSQVVNRGKPNEPRAITTEINVFCEGPTVRTLELVRQAALLSPSILPDPPPKVLIKDVGRRRILASVFHTVQDTTKVTQAKGEVIINFDRLNKNAKSRQVNVIIERTLSAVALFEPLSEKQLERIVSAVASKDLEEGDLLFAAGTSGSSLYIVSQGVLDVAHQDGTVVRSLGRIGPGDHIGEVSMMTGDPRYVTVVALTPATILELDKASLVAMLADDADLGRALERAVSRGANLIERDAATRVGASAGAGRSVIDVLVAFLRR